MKTRLLFPGWCVCTVILSTALIQDVGANEFTNHTYRVIAGNFTWREAKADAEARGGHLATITSQAEYDYVLGLGVLPQASYWLGATDEQNEGVWTWVTGEPWGFTAWRPGEPNNLGPENYLLSSGIPDGHRWNDWGKSDSKLSHYILELDDLFCSPRKALATAQVVNGFVVGAIIDDAGCGYSNAPVVIIEGGGGTGATAVAVVNAGHVISIQITDAGRGYVSQPRIVIASPPFAPTVSISVSRVKVVQQVVLGRSYVLESSHDAKTWSEALPPFTATSESITNEFDTDVTGRFFRTRETQ